MKLNKIVAFAASAVLAFSTVASAATSKADVEALSPKWEIDVTPLTTKDEVKAASSAKYAKDYDDATYDYYKLTYKLTDVGNLRQANWEDVLGIYNITLELKTTDIKSGGVKSSFIDRTTNAVGQNATIGETDRFTFTFTADGGVENPYPRMNQDEGNQEQEFAGSFEFPFAVAVDKGATVNVNQFYAMITYITDAGKVEFKNVTMPTSLTIGKTAPVETCAEFAVNSVNKFDNGYVWTADLTKGTKDIASFKAKFEAGEAVAERAVKNVDVFNKFAGEGKVSFNIGLETKKELTKATFTVNDGDDHAVEAPVK